MTVWIQSSFDVEFDSRIKQTSASTEEDEFSFAVQTLLEYRTELLHVHVLVYLT